MNINGETPARTLVDLRGWRCIGTDWDGKCDNGDVPDGEVSDEIYYWSDPKIWTETLGEERLPRDGDDIVVPPTWNLHYDIPASEAPKLTSLQINGNLTFDDTADRLLMSGSVWVRAGNLTIGNKTHPFAHKATITLLGDNTENYWAFTNAVEAGNKNLVVTGAAHIYGTPVEHPRSRLRANALPGHTEITVEAELGWR
jgi:hypothetical protein